MSGHVLEMDPQHRYKCVAPEHKGQPCDGKVFRSVTTILGDAVPKNLSWYGQTRGVIGIKQLIRFAKYDVRRLNPSDMLAACKAEGICQESAHAATPADRARLARVVKYDLTRMSAEQITDALKRERLTVNHHRDEAADGGTVVHKALQDYIERGTIPSAMDVPEAKRGSIRGVAKFIIDYKPEFIAAEVKTLSVEHEFAGTFDFDAIIYAEIYKTDRGLLKLRPADATLRVLGDVKTSKWVYPSSHFPQLEAYEGARVEAGETPTDVRAVLWTPASGVMELVPSTATFADFLALKASAESIKRLDKAWRRPRKAKAA